MHSDKCKQRLLEALRATPLGRARVENAKKRQSECIVRRMEHGDCEKEAADAEVPNDRDARLDHDVGENGQLKHEDEMDTGPVKSDEKADDEMMALATMMMTR